jgi:hypothetical protein
MRHPEKAKASAKKWHHENKDRVQDSRRKWVKNNRLKVLFYQARQRSKSGRRRSVASREFTITIEDIPPMGTHCPVLGHPFPPPGSGRHPYTPSIDRIDSTKGYIPGNVWVISWRANILKSDGTLEEHEMLVEALRKIMKTAHQTEREKTVAALKKHR